MRSLIGINAEIAEKEDQARVMSKRLMEELKKNKPLQVDQLTERHNALYEEIEELIAERSERVRKAKTAVEENKIKIFSEEGIKVQDFKIPVSDIIYLLYKLYGIRVECKKNPDDEWMSDPLILTLENSEVNSIRAKK